MLDKFAEELKSNRVQRGLTLQQVAQKTKIDYKFLEVMEDGDFSFLPELYVKAFLKNYARVIGLDEDLVIMKFEAAKSGKLFVNDDSPAAEQEPKEIKKKESVKPPKPVAAPKESALNPGSFKDNQKVIFIAAAVVVLLTALGYYFLGREDTDIIVTEKPLDEVVQENQERYIEEEKISVQEENPLDSSDSLHLNIASSETSWVKIVYDDKSFGEFILFPMSQKNVKTSENFKITFGNSQGIKLKLNGSELVFNSKSSVARVLIDSTGLHYLPPQPGIQP